MTECTISQECQRVGEVLTRIGDRWSVLVILTLGQGPRRFNDLKRHMGITQRMLSITLRALERDGLISRTEYDSAPPRVEYALTDFGMSFYRPVKDLADWATGNLSVIDTARAAFDADQASDESAA